MSSQADIQVFEKNDPIEERDNESSSGATLSEEQRQRWLDAGYSHGNGLL